MPLIKKHKAIAKRKTKHVSFKKNRQNPIIRCPVTRSMSRRQHNFLHQRYFHQNEGNFKILPMRGDGNCLFRALAYHTLGRQTSHQNLREMVVKEICDNWDYFSDFVADPDIDSYEENMLTSGTFGGEAEIVAFTHIFTCSVNVYLLNDSEREPLCFGGAGTSCFLLYSGLTDFGHYDVLKPMSRSNYDVFDYRLSILYLRNLVKESADRKIEITRERGRIRFMDIGILVK